MDNYLAYGEWQSKPGQMEMHEIEKTPVYQTGVTRCEWNETWKRFGLAEYGRFYCESIDNSLVEGFTGADTLQVHSFLSRGEPMCHFEWTGLALTPDKEAELQARRQRNAERHTRGFDYHTAHLYFTFVRTLERLLGDQGRAIVAKTDADYQETFSEAQLQAIKAFRDTDFSQAD